MVSVVSARRTGLGSDRHVLPYFRSGSQVFAVRSMEESQACEVPGQTSSSTSAT